MAIKLIPTLYIGHVHCSLFTERCICNSSHLHLRFSLTSNATSFTFYCPMYHQNVNFPPDDDSSDCKFYVQYVLNTQQCTTNSTFRSKYCGSQYAHCLLLEKEMENYSVGVGVLLRFWWCIQFSKPKYLVYHTCQLKCVATRYCHIFQHLPSVWQ